MSHRHRRRAFLVKKAADQAYRESLQRLQHEEEVVIELDPPVPARPYGLFQPTDPTTAAIRELTTIQYLSQIGLIKPIPSFTSRGVLD